MKVMQNRSMSAIFLGEGKMVGWTSAIYDDASVILKAPLICHRVSDNVWISTYERKQYVHQLCSATMFRSLTIGRLAYKTSTSLSP